jgi:hypothetical protein
VVGLIRLSGLCGELCHFGEEVQVSLALIFQVWGSHHRTAALQRQGPYLRGCLACREAQHCTSSENPSR